MTLTVREKDHWRERIQRRIDRKIKEIEASEPSHVWEEMERRAEQMALNDLGIAELADDEKRIQEEVKRLERERRRVSTHMLAITRGVDPSTVELEYGWQYEIDTLIRKRKELFRDQLQAAHPKGQQILKLQHEKDELLDTVWLATSASQIKELWSQIAEGLECELTPFQQKALAIEPIPMIPTRE